MIIRAPQRLHSKSLKALIKADTLPNAWNFLISFFSKEEKGMKGKFSWMRSFSKIVGTKPLFCLPILCFPICRCDLLLVKLAAEQQLFENRDTDQLLIVSKTPLL